MLIDILILMICIKVKATEGYSLKTVHNYFDIKQKLISQICFAIKIYSLEIIHGSLQGI